MKNRSWKLPPQGLICLGLGLITLAVYWPTLTHGFLGFDDQQYVTENAHVRAGLNWGGMVWAFKSFSASNWHPLTWVSHMADCQAYGIKPAGHHLTNVLLHCANVVLLFLWLNRMTGAVWRSACVAGLFAWHPLHVESVAWVAERKDVLSTLFFMLTAGAYTLYVERAAGEKHQTSNIKHQANSKLQAPKKTGEGGSRFGFHVSCWYFLSLTFFTLGLMSKPMVVTVPFVLLLLDYWPLRRMSRSALLPLVWEKIPFLVLSAVGCWLTVAAQKQSFTIASLGALPLGQRIAHALVSYAHYLGAAFVPRHLAVHYPYPAATPTIELAGAATVLAVVTLLAVWSATRRPYVLVGWLWFLGTLVPVIGLVQVGDQAWADRYTYVPLIGIFMAVVWGVAEGTKNQAPNTKYLIWAGAVGIGVALLAGTWRQLGYWKDTRTLFEHAAAVTQNNTRAITMLGSLEAAEGRLEEAQRLFRLALSYSPENPETHFNLGKALDQEGKLDEAIAEYRRSLWARQWRDRAHILMGVALAKQHKYEEAAEHYEAALALNPESATAENNLARVLHSQGRLDEAIRHYSAALRLDPGLVQAHNNLGVLLLQKGRMEEGITELKEAVRLKPADVESEYNLALALNQAEKWAEAAEIFGRLAPGRPRDTKLHCEFGLALMHLGKTREGQSHYAHALLVQPDLPEALDRLAWIAATDPRPEFRNGEEAVHMAERACELTGRKQPEMLMTLAAAYGETGRFPEALRTGEEAKALASQAAQRQLAARCQSLLSGLKEGKPWREKEAGMATGTASAPSSSK